MIGGIILTLASSGIWVKGLNIIRQDMDLITTMEFLIPLTWGVRGCPNPGTPNCTPRPCPDPSDKQCNPLPLRKNEVAIQQPADLTTLR